MPTTERLELRDGQWAELRTSPTAAQNLAVMRAAEKASGDGGSYSEWAYETGRQLLHAWHVIGDDGQPLRTDEWGDAPADLVDAICTRAQQLWGEWRTKSRPLAVNGSTSSPT